MAKDKDLMKQPESALARPSYLKDDDIRGTEHITKEDVQFPRLAIAQGLSPQMLEENSRYIEGLKIGDLFNNLTNRNYGKGPVEFTVVRADPPRGVEFYPRLEGGGVRDIDVPLNDPRMAFTKDDDGGSKPPVATMFRDFVIMLLPTRELIAISFKSTSLKVGKDLNTLMKFRRAPSFAGKYTLTTGMATNNKGTFAIPVIRNSEATDDETEKDRPGWVSTEIYELAEGIYEGIKDRPLVLDREPGDDDAVPFDA